MNHVTFILTARITNGGKPAHQLEICDTQNIDLPEDLDKAIQKLSIASDQMVSELGKTLGISRKKP